MEHAAAVERVLHGARVKARVVLRVHSFLCVRPVVASSDLIGVVPSNLAVHREHQQTASPSRGQPRTCRDLRFPPRARDLRPHC